MVRIGVYPRIHAFPICWQVRIISNEYAKTLTQTLFWLCLVLNVCAVVIVTYPHRIPTQAGIMSPTTDKCSVFNSCEVEITANATCRRYTNVMKVNQTWHKSHRMPKNPTVAQRVEWHRGHEVSCGCRPMPVSIKAVIDSEYKRP